MVSFSDHYMTAGFDSLAIITYLIEAKVAHFLGLTMSKIV